MPDIDLDGGRVRDAVPSLDDADYVTRGELEGVINARNDARYLRRDGGNNLTEDIPAGGHTLTNIRDASSAQEPVSKAQLDALAATVATDAELSAGMASTRSSLLPITILSSTVWVPTFSGQVLVELIGGGGGGGAGGTGGTSDAKSSGAGGGAGARTRAILNVTAGDSVAITIGPGGAAGIDAPGGTGHEGGRGGGGGGETTLSYGSIYLHASGGGGGGGGAGHTENGYNGTVGSGTAAGGTPGAGGTGGILGTAPTGGDSGGAPFNAGGSGTVTSGTIGTAGGAGCHQGGVGGGGHGGSFGTGGTTAAGSPGAVLIWRLS